MIDRDVFERLRQTTAGDPAMLAELCRDYLTEARSTVAQLRSAVARKDAHALRERAHYLRGSSVMIGATKLSEYCATMEQMGRNANFQQIDELLESAAASLNAVEAELASELGPTVLPAEGSAA